MLNIGRPVFACIIGCMVLSMPAAAQNLVVNGDFETGLDGWQWFGTEPNTATTSTDTPSGVGNSADLDIVEVLGLPWLVQDVPVTEGVELTFSASVREVRQFHPDFDAWIAAQIYMLSSPESGAILASGFVLFTNPEWEQQGFDITVPPTATIARILFTPQDPDFGVGTGQYRIDDVSLVPKSTTATPGDFNNDNSVNAADFALWKSGFGSGTMLEDGDGDGDGDVDGADFLIWQENFGAAPMSSFTVVPEPPAMLLLGFAAAPFSVLRKRPSSRRP